MEEIVEPVKISVNLLNVDSGSLAVLRAGKSKLSRLSFASLILKPKTLRRRSAHTWAT